MDFGVVRGWKIVKKWQKLPPEAHAKKQPIFGRAFFACGGPPGAILAPSGKSGGGGRHERLGPALLSRVEAIATFPGRTPISLGRGCKNRSLGKAGFTPPPEDRRSSEIQRIILWKIQMINLDDKADHPKRPGATPSAADYSLRLMPPTEGRG